MEVISMGLFTPFPLSLIRGSSLWSYWHILIQVVYCRVERTLTVDIYIISMYSNVTIKGFYFYSKIKCIILNITLHLCVFVWIFLYSNCLTILDSLIRRGKNRNLCTYWGHSNCVLQYTIAWLSVVVVPTHYEDDNISLLARGENSPPTFTNMKLSKMLNT